MFLPYHRHRREFCPGAALERLWLLEEWEAADRRHYVLAVDPDADPAAREAAAREAKKAADRVTLHKSEQATALYMGFHDAKIFNPGALAALLDEALLGRITRLEERCDKLEKQNTRLRKRNAQMVRVVASRIVEPKGVFA